MQKYTFNSILNTLHIIQGKISWIVFAEVLGQVLEETARPEEDSFKETFKVRIYNI